MKRKHLPQISQQKWFPGFLRNCIHEFMTWFVGKVHAAKPFLPVIQEGLEYTDSIIALEANVGAGFETVEGMIDPQITVKRMDIQNFDPREEGLYLFVNCFHQLRPEKALSMLDEISKNNQPVVMVEGNNDSLWQVVGMTVFVPLTVLLTAPFVKPFRVSRLIFTYLIPILPIVTLIDGFLALFKLYAPDDLNQLVGSLENNAYQWKSGKSDNGRGGKIIYLIGHPVSDALGKKYTEQSDGGTLSLHPY